MPDLKRITFSAAFFLVMLRISVGWQFFYEGLWKIESQQTSSPWTAKGYLKNAQGPLRSEFRKLTEDLDDFDWLDYDKTSQRWDDWQERFVEHYELDDKQKRSLRILIDGNEIFVGKVELPQLPEGVKFGGSLARAIRFDETRNKLVVDGERHLTPKEKGNLLKLVNVVENPADADRAKNELAKKYREAVEEVYKRASHLSFRERLAVLLKGDPERVSIIQKKYAPGSVDYKRQGKIDEYKNRLKKYEEELGVAKQEFQHEHLQKQAATIRELHAELVGPVKALEKDLHWRASKKILTSEQLEKGAIPKVWTQIAKIDFATMWGLLALGGLLIVGLFSRITAFFSAILIASFYLAMPPFPGIPPAPGPEHSLIVNKNFIEIMVLFALTLIPTGKYFGLDGFLHWRGIRKEIKIRNKRRFQRKPRSAKAEAPQTSTKATSKGITYDVKKSPVRKK